MTLRWLHVNKYLVERGLSIVGGLFGGGNGKCFVASYWIRAVGCYEILCSKNEELRVFFHHFCDCYVRLKV